jgi:hypothetical protein
MWLELPDESAFVRMVSVDPESLEGDYVQPPVAIPVPGLDVVIQAEQAWVYSVSGSRFSGLRSSGLA